MRKLLFVSIIILYFSCNYSTAQTINPLDVIIDEIHADPDPIVGLPNAEFVELKNRSKKALDLQGFRLISSTTKSGIFPSVILPADSFLIITSTTNADLFAPFGRVLGVSSFPALVNTGTTLSLLSKENVTIHSVTYNTNWYGSDIKSNGGWSLEMIDTENACAGENNWKASIDARGGTPGSKNSVSKSNPDEEAPALLRATAIDSLTLLLTFSEPVDSLSAGTFVNYIISDGINTPIAATTIAPTFNKVQLTLRSPLTRNTTYTVTANNITDCSGNIIQAVKTAKVGLAAVIESLDIIINEILFNPKPGGIDYVELYNRSNKILDLKNLYITNRSTATSALGTLRQISAESISFFPGDFYIVSENGRIVKQLYTAKNPDSFLDIQMPSLPDNAGSVIIINSQQKIVDELRYDSKWHYELINNEQGVSLERIDYNKPTQSKDNWTSAASTAGFGTPSFQNSQLRADISVQGSITITPKTFSPDNDGVDDKAAITYQMSETGFVANITIFDAAGRPVRSLAKNATLALNGTLTWDGLDDKFKKVAIGAYIIYTDIFNLNGKKKSFKNVVVVAGRL